MLVLTFKHGDRVQIGDNIVIYLHSIRGNRVQLSFDAPREVQILRGEFVDGQACKPPDRPVESPTAERDSSAHE